MKMRISKERLMNIIFKTVGLIILFLVLLLFLFPILWLFDASFRPMIEIFRIPPVLLQKGFSSFSSYSFNSYIKAIVDWGLIESFINSSVVTICGIALTLAVCSLGAYAFSYLKFPGKNILFVIILSTMMLPLTTMIVPYYRVLRMLGLVNSLLGLIIPYSASAFCVFLLRQYFIKIPSSFLESARLDGTTNFQILRYIIMPLAKPALAALAIIQFRVIWNDFLYPIIILRDDNLFTLPIKVMLIDNQHFNKPYDAIIATGFVTAIVPIILFLIFQRQFIEGLTGGLKS